MVKPKLPLHSMGRVVHISKSLITQVRQQLSIGGSPSITHKGPYHQINTSVPSSKVLTSPLRKTHSLIKKLHSRMTKTLQPNPVVCQRNSVMKPPQKSVITLGQDWNFSLAWRTSLHLAKCLAQHS